MSEPDQDKIVGRITKKLFWTIIPMLVVFILINIATDIRANGKKANEAFVEAHYSELYLLLAEQTTLMKSYIDADEREKDQIWAQIEKIAERMDLYVFKDTKRGEYGKNFTAL